MQINRKCGLACVYYHLSALKPLRSFGQFSAHTYILIPGLNAHGLQSKILISPLSE